MPAGCYHCGLPVPSGAPFVAEVAGEPRPMCCAGCKAVAEFIDGQGMAAWYAHRERPEVAELTPVDQRFAHYDSRELAAKYLHRHDGEAEVVLEVGGMYCAACGWLLARTLEGVDAVGGVDVNAASRRAVVRFDPDRLPLSRLLDTIARAGFRPQPTGSPDAGDEADAEYRRSLRRLIVAAAAGMQVMMFAFALYAGEAFGIDGAIEKFLRIVSLLVTLPIVFYSARPFFAGAWRGLAARSPGMDLPGALAIASAFAASVRAVWLSSGDVYFDSVAMFVLFLSGTRFLEMRARQRSGDQVLALAELLPDVCRRIDEQGREATVPAGVLASGDRLRIRPGDVLPADGEVLTGRLAVDESLLTGESLPVERATGTTVLAGSSNTAGSATVRVTRVGTDTSLSEIGRLLERAKAERPPLALLADRIAAWFVVGVLAIAAGTGLAWLRADPARAFEVALATLVVTCPCALALATPAALAAAATRLARQGSFLMRSGILTTFRRGATVIFDKTGTLTQGAPRVAGVRRCDAGRELTDDDCLALAAAIESASEHVLARAFPGNGGLTASHVEAETGCGVEGVVDGCRYRVGSAAWVGELAGSLPDPGDATGTLVYLGSERGILAEFLIADDLRADAAAAVASLGAAGYNVVIASGDRPAAVAEVAARLGVADWHAGLSPAGKVALVDDYRRRGETVIMVGDGVNDAPVLEAADASLAMDAGTALARASADAIALGRRLKSVVDVADTAAATRRIIRQNVAWAIAYNVTAVPLAAGGWLSPWMAALGMSMSSLVVVANALRLNRTAGGAGERGREANGAARPVAT